MMDKCSTCSYNKEIDCKEGCILNLFEEVDLFEEE